MRIWDVPPQQLCRQHLLGEHRELHGLWNILVVRDGTGGYSNHPETKRWVGKTRALFDRHQELVAEMERRGYQHRSPLEYAAATGRRIQDSFIDSPEDQMRLLASKPCDCPQIKDSAISPERSRIAP
jgi:Pyrimidine dimer DNA glycosylase